eukprot:s111_g23.t1
MLQSSSWVIHGEETQMTLEDESRTGCFSMPCVQNPRFEPLIWFCTCATFSLAQVILYNESAQVRIYNESLQGQECQKFRLS